MRLKAVLALCFFVSLIIVACSKEPDRPDRAQKNDAPEETAMVVERAGKPPEGVKSIEVGPGERHTEGNVDYQQSPPVGGPHNPVWQNCGYYDKPVRDENAVHSLEHGAVWITYSPDLPQDQVDELQGIAESQSYILVSPYLGLPDNAPVVASAWGKQLELQSTGAPELERFIRAYGKGVQAPDPGAPCTGGVGRPA